MILLYFRKVELCVCVCVCLCVCVSGRAGEHQDLEALKEVPLSTIQQAVCLNMTEITGEYTYDGVSGEAYRRARPTVERGRL